MRAVDFDLEAVTPMPDVENTKTLTKFEISPERHEAYQKLWNGLTYFGIIANTAVWLYIWLNLIPYFYITLFKPITIYKKNKNIILIDINIYQI